MSLLYCRQIAERNNSKHGSLRLDDAAELARALGKPGRGGGDSESCAREAAGSGEWAAPGDTRQPSRPRSRRRRRLRTWRQWCGAPGTPLEPAPAPTGAGPATVPVVCFSGVPAPPGSKIPDPLGAGALAAGADQAPPAPAGRQIPRICPAPRALSRPGPRRRGELAGARRPRRGRPRPGRAPTTGSGSALPAWVGNRPH